MRYAADARANLEDRAVGFLEAHRSFGRWLANAFVVTAEEAAALTERAVGDAEVALVVDTADDRAHGNEKSSEAVHESFDAGLRSLFKSSGALKHAEFR